MSYYDDPKHVEEYIAMSEGYDGRNLIEHLHQHLPTGRKVLELGMGPGRDLDLLAEQYDVIGSDASDAFLQHYRQRYPDASLIQLDAVTLEADFTVDAIYSNKVLHCLTPEQLTQSLQRQAELLTDNGLVMHSFWRGDSEETFHGVYSAYYQLHTLTEVFGAHFDVIDSGTYKEMETDDSVWVLARKSSTQSS